MIDSMWVSAAEFFRNPKMVGSAFPATARLVNHMLKPVKWENVQIAVEYGPGSGRFTIEILKRMRADAQLMVIEKGDIFVKHLSAQCRDPRVIVVEGSASDVLEHLDRHGFDQPDFILTGLPFSTLEDREAEVIMRKTAMALKPAGQLAAYQMRTAIRPLIETYFAQIAHGYEWWNLPPCHLYWAGAPNQGVP